MNPLTLIWMTAAAMALGALLWMSGLIVMRLVHDRRSAARAASRRQVEAALIAAIQGGASAAAQLAPFAHRARLMAEVLLEFLGIVRGHDQARLLELLRNLRVDAVLRRRLRRGSVAGRLACIEALSVFPGPETLATLEAAASGGRPRLRLAALRSILAVGGDVTVDRLLNDLATGALAPSGMFGELIRELTAADPAAAMAAAERRNLSATALAIVLDALGEAGDYGALPLLVQHAAGDPAPVRVSAVHALGRLRHPAAEPALRTALSDPDSQVRAAASEAAGVARLPGLTPALAGALSDPVWRVRFQAAAALSKLGADGLAALQGAADGPSEVASLAASLTLAESVA
jgi:hypothetical protein